MLHVSTDSSAFSEYKQSITVKLLLIIILILFLLVLR
jgi:hypothetical protein